MHDCVCLCVCLCVCVCVCVCLCDSTQPSEGVERACKCVRLQKGRTQGQGVRTYTCVSGYERKKTRKPARRLPDTALFCLRCECVCVCVSASQQLSRVLSPGQRDVDWSGVPGHTEHNNKITEHSLHEPSAEASAPPCSRTFISSQDSSR